MPLLERSAGALYYDAAGAGEPVLFLAGLGFGGDAWALQTAALRDRCRVITMDNRGSGRSAAPEGPYTIDQMARDAVDVLDALEVATASVVGASLGGVIAQVLAATYPNRANRLVLLTTTAQQDAAALARLDEWERIARSEGVAAFFAHVLESSVTEAYRTAQAPMIAGLVARAAEAAPPLHGLLGQLAALRTCSTQELLPKIQVPVLVLAAEEDEVLPIHHSEALAAALPNAMLRTVSGGHACCVEASEPVNRALAEFLLAE